MNERSHKELFHLIRGMIPDSQQVISLDKDVSIGEAFKLMREQNINQVPVMNGTSVLGVFSYRSFAQHLPETLEAEKEILSLSVDLFLENLSVAHLEDRVSELIAEFDAMDAVLIGTKDNLLGVLSTIDAVNYFYRVANAFVLIGEIELSIRTLIESAVDTAQLIKCIDDSLTSKYMESESRPKVIHDLTFADLVALVQHGKNWEYFEPVFRGTRKLLSAKLKGISDLRNDVFHFRRDLSMSEYDRLRSVRDWLHRLYQTRFGGTKRG